MYTKEELESMDNAQLMGIANSLGVKVSQNDEKESVIYAILDKAAEDSAANNTETPKRKRTRIAKKEKDKGKRAADAFFPTKSHFHIGRNLG